ncbi:MAG: hydrogenase 2 operon protein HybA [Rhodoferax sp.]
MANRRDYLKGCLAGGGAAASALAPAVADARETLQRPPEGLGLLYDSTLCVGCQACVAACKQVNENPAEFRTLDKLWDSPLDTSGHTFNIIKVYSNGNGETKNAEQNGFAFMKTSCMHCADPSCVSACPVSAMRKDPVTGIVSYDPDACFGCRYCVAACAFGIPKYQYDSPIGKIGKCELCRHRHKDGHYSACAEVCPTGATLFGRTSDLLVEAKRRLALKPGATTKIPRGRLPYSDAAAEQASNWRKEPDQRYEAQMATYLQHVYGDTEYGGTQVLKLSAVNFEKLGMPDLGPESSAAKSETIQHTLYQGMVMPIALLGAMTWVARRNVVPEDDESQGGQP